MNDTITLSREELQRIIATEVEKHDSSKEEAEARLEIQKDLAEARTLFETLSAAMKSKDEKIAEYEKALANLDADPTSVEVSANKRIVELEAQMVDFKRRAEVAEAALDTIAREETTGTRMEELAELDLTLEEDADAQDQYRKVRAMSDDEFARYKKELIAIKAKFAVQQPAAEEAAVEETTEVAELSAEDISAIAQSLGCDPADSTCVSMVKAVAKKVNDVKSKASTQTPAENANEDKTVSDNKETASQKDNFSLGEVLSMVVDGKSPAVTSLRDKLAAAWAKEDTADKKNS